MNFVLEIEAEGFPRYIGPFAYQAEASDWARTRIANGSWSIIPLTSQHGPWGLP